MSHSKTNKEPVLLDVSVRPENGRKIVLLHFSDRTFYNLRLKKGMDKSDVVLHIQNFVMQIPV